MRKIVSAVMLLGLCLSAAGGAARGQGEGVRARELAAHFNKEKHKVKEKRGVRLEVFLQIRAEPAARANAAEYSGTYGAEQDYALELRVAADGGAEGGGTEPSAGGARRFTLKGARVSGALLTGMKVYEDGATERLEGVFINRTVRHAPQGAVTTAFGLGVVFDPPKEGEGFHVTRLFYELKR